MNMDSDRELILAMTPTFNLLSEDWTDEDKSMQKITNVLESEDDPATIKVISRMIRDTLADMQTRLGLPATKPSEKVSWKVRRSYRKLFWVCFGLRVKDASRSGQRMKNQESLEEAASYLEFLREIGRNTSSESLSEKVGQMLFAMPSHLANRV